MHKAVVFVGIVAVLGIMVQPAGAGLPAPEGKAKVKFVIEPGLFGGFETGVPGGDESTVRVHTEGGLELWWQIPNSKLGRSAGLAVSSSAGWYDWRFSVGPRGTLPITKDWALQGFAGPLVSVGGKTGVQTRIGANYRNWFCVSSLYQTEGREVHSLYGGIAATGRPGLYTGLVITGIGVGYVVVCLLAVMFHGIGS